VTGPSPYEVPDFVSGDGRFRVRWAASSTVGNAWIVQPHLTDTRTGRVLLDLWGASTWDWDGTVEGCTASTVTLALRRFPGTVSCTVVIDADALTCAISDAARGGKGLDPLRERLRAAGLTAA
jgi:hypothetical protein